MKSDAFVNLFFLAVFAALAFFFSLDIVIKMLALMALWQLVFVNRGKTSI